MQSFEIVHEFEGSLDDYWALYFDPEYNRAFYGAVNIELTVLREERGAGKIERTVKYTSLDPVPALVKPFLPDGLGYVEHAVFDEAARRLEHRVEPSAFADRTDIRGAITVEAIAPGRIRRTYAGTVSIRMPMLGARFEINTVRQMKESQDKTAEVSRAWLTRRASAS